MKRGFTLIGLLVVIVIILVLYSLTFESLKGIQTGTAEDGSAVPASKGRLTDMFQLQQLGQSLTMIGLSSGETFPRPSNVTENIEDDVTSSVYSLLIAHRAVSPESLISPLDYANAMVYQDYQWGRWDPDEGPQWDEGFSADLDDLTNVSYAHLVLYGDRADHWSSRKLDSSMPIFGNRGPQDGETSDMSLTCDPETGRWTGYMVFGDGHVSLLQDISEATRRPRSGGVDGFFMIDDENRHADAILGFTSDMDDDGPTLQWD
ncbi:MAG: prepilin-type N-terminal cleavage/methylation domain-containing protein [Planctomycetes bacterium]|jgi:prepilin-type N-terminal cleavage/methylation domain-containing protein|nr:prepilin-type N-terminal cleavage/methylation domain-containing protein [Planctomycetota bacterium]